MKPVGLWGGVLALVLALAVGAPVSAATDSQRALRDRTPAPGRMVQVPRIPGEQHLWCQGTPHGPTVVVISGAGDFSLSWRQVQDRLSARHRICTYDRAGLGWSASSPQPRTGQIIVTELHRLLSAAGVTGQVVLVGHSMGGIYARMYAAQYPRHIRGIALIDPGDERLDMGLGAAVRRQIHDGARTAAAGQQAAGRTCATGAYAQNLGLLPLATVLPEADARTYRRLQAGWCRTWRASAAEGLAAATTWRQARRLGLGPGSLSDTRVGIVVSDAQVDLVTDPVINERVVAHWRALQQNQRRLSTHTRLRVATGSSHLVMLDRPDLVAQTIRWAAR